MWVQVWGTMRAGGVDAGATAVACVRRLHTVRCCATGLWVLWVSLLSVASLWLLLL